MEYPIKTGIVSAVIVYGVKYYLDQQTILSDGSAPSFVIPETATTMDKVIISNYIVNQFTDSDENFVYYLMGIFGGVSALSVYIVNRTSI